MIDLSTGKPITRREAVKGLAGLAGIIAAGKAPAAVVRSMLGARGVAFGGIRKVKTLISLSTQYINTHEFCGSSSKVEIKFIHLGEVGSSAIFGGRIAYDNNSFVIWATINRQNSRFDFTPPNSFVADNVNGIKLASGRDYLIAKDGRFNYIDGVNVSNNNDHNFAGSRECYLFGCNNNGVPSFLASFRIYYAKIWQNGVLKKDYIPVIYNSVPCLWDNVSNTPFYNQGTGTFGWQEMDGTIVNPT